MALQYKVRYTVVRNGSNGSQSETGECGITVGENGNGDLGSLVKEVVKSVNGNRNFLSLSIIITPLLD